MYPYNKIIKPCAFLFIALLLSANITKAIKLMPATQGLSEFITAFDAYEHQFESAMGVWQIVEYDLSSGAAPSPETKQQLQYVVNTLGAMSADLSTMSKHAKSTESQQIISDVAMMEKMHAAALLSSKALLNSILTTGQVDYQAVASTSNSMTTMERLVDCIRREIQVITGGK